MKLELTEQELNRVLNALQMVNCPSIEGVQNMKIVAKIQQQYQEQIQPKEQV